MVAAEGHIDGNTESHHNQIHGHPGEDENFRIDSQSVVPTPSEEAGERDEKLEVHCDPRLFRQNTSLTPSQGGKRPEGLQHEEKEALRGNVPKPTEGATPEPARNDVVHPPATQESPPDDRNGNGKNDHLVAGSSARFNIGELSPPSTLSPAEMRRGPRILGLGGTATGVFPLHFDELPGE